MTEGAALSDILTFLRMLECSSAGDPASFFISAFVSFAVSTDFIVIASFGSAFVFWLIVVSSVLLFLSSLIFFEKRFGREGREGRVSLTLSLMFFKIDSWMKAVS